MHGASLRASLPSLIEDHPLDTMRPGDVFVMNDPYRGGIHANDLIVFRPVFGADGVCYFGGTLIHVADLGGVSVGGLAALATDTFAEGLLLPPVRLYSAGEPDATVTRILERNSRAPTKVMGDVRALVAGANVLARRTEELLVRYGEAGLHELVDRLMGQAESRMRDELRAIPSGTYHGSFVVDNDGLDPSRRYTVRVAVTVGDGTVDVDFEGTDAQSPGPINASFSQALSGVIFGIRCFVDPSIPMNEGVFVPVGVHFPPGTLVNPRPPAACGGRIVTVTAAIDAIIDALGEARPEHAVAPSGIIHVYTLSGRSGPTTSWLTLGYEFGGIGGRRGSDGPDATGAFMLGGRSVIPQIEPIEAFLPVVFRHSALLTDSGGPGQWRGGLGVDVAVEMLDEALLTARGDRVLVPPPGKDGGLPGAPGSFAVRRADGTLEQLAAKQTDVALHPGDQFLMRTSGGGGLGPIEARDPELVRVDVRERRVSPAAAAADYGVEVEVPTA
jgi:N-methylhydantoinase B